VNPWFSVLRDQVCQPRKPHANRTDDKHSIWKVLGSSVRDRQAVETNSTPDTDAISGLYPAQDYFSGLLESDGKPALIGRTSFWRVVTTTEGRNSWPVVLLGVGPAGLPRLDGWPWNGAASCVVWQFVGVGNNPGRGSRWRRLRECDWGKRRSRECDAPNQRGDACDGSAALHGTICWRNVSLVVPGQTVQWRSTTLLNRFGAYRRAGWCGSVGKDVFQ
jgi:hypothetical protein